MKYLINVILVCIFFSAKSQDCQTLNQLTIFHGLAFGKPIPDSIKKITEFDDYGQREIFIFKDSLSIEEKVYLKLFRFGVNYEDFSNLSLTVSSENKLHTYYLWTTLTSDDVEEINNKQLPYRFLELLRRCKTMFGNYTENKNEIEDFGLWKTQSYIWNCSRMELVLTLTYGAKSEDLNHISITLIDIVTQKSGKLNELKN